MSAQKKNMQVFFAKLLINLVSQSAFYAETLLETIESDVCITDLFQNKSVAYYQFIIISL